MTGRKGTDFVSVERISDSILVARGQRVLLDSELAVLYGVTTTRLNQQVRRNLERFPGDFMFQLTAEEHNSLMLQIATSKPGRGGRRKPSLVFTEHGAIMVATLLNSSRAVEMSIYVVRAFVQLRNGLTPNTELPQKFTELDRRVGSHETVIVRMMKTPGERRNLSGTGDDDKKSQESAWRRSLRSQIVTLKIGRLRRCENTAARLTTVLKPRYRVEDSAVSYWR